METVTVAVSLDLAPLLSVASSSHAMVDAIGLNAHLHPDFGSYSGYGIPYNIVGTATPRSTVRFQYASESDKVGYPIPAHPRIEPAFS